MKNEKTSLDEQIARIKTGVQKDEKLVRDFDNLRDRTAKLESQIAEGTISTEDLEKQLLEESKQFTALMEEELKSELPDYGKVIKNLKKEWKAGKISKQEYNNKIGDILGEISNDLN